MAEYIRKRGPFQKYGAQHCDDHNVYLPTEDEIYRECEAIRDTWTEDMKFKRVITKPCPVEFKVFIDGKRRIKKGDHDGSNSII